jgi:voltage-dependent calcium channel L type alpha-1D
MDNPVRRKIYNLVNKQAFDNVILCLIILSTLFIAIENPLNSPTSILMVFFQWTDYLITAVFTVEMWLKIIAFGFLFNGRDSYLRDNWN